jgi:plasmid maintenance system antidote protein VapI
MRQQGRSLASRDDGIAGEGDKQVFLYGVASGGAKGGINMPRVRGYTARQKLDFQKKHMAETCEILLVKNRVTKKKVADFVGITPETVCQQLHGRQNISTGVLIAIISLTDADAETVINMLKIKDAKQTSI